MKPAVSILTQISTCSFLIETNIRWQKIISQQYLKNLSKVRIIGNFETSYAELECYVFEYCSCFTEFTFFPVKEYAFSSIKNPLTSVESVSFDGGNLLQLKFGSMVELDPKCNV